MAEFTVTGLRVVQEVARTGSFSAAAASLGYTQSGVSRQVAATEAAAGGPLFTRGPRGVTPTAAGGVVVRRANRVLGEVDGLGLELAGMRDRLAGRLVVGAFPTAAASLVPRAMARVVSRHPELRVELQEAASPAQVRRLRAGRIEVAVLATGPGLPDDELVDLPRERLTTGRQPGIAVRHDHPLVDRDRVEVADLADETWIVGAGAEGEPQFGAWPTLESPRVGHRVRSWPARLGLVAAGFGIAVVPSLAADIVPIGVRWLPVHDPTGPTGRATWAVTLADPSHAAKAMVRALQSAVQQ